MIYIIQTVSKYDFQNAFIKSDTYNNNFSEEGLSALFDYLEEYEESTGEQIELDIVALCCEYTEYKNLKEIQENYNKIESLEDLRNNTTVIEFDGGIIIQDF